MSRDDFPRPVAALRTHFVVWGSTLALDRNRTWSDSLSLRTDALTKSPDCTAAHERLCLALYDARRFPEALVNRGLACMVLGQAEEAMSSYRQALMIDPKNAEAHNVMGVALTRSGRRDEALSHFERAVRLAPENAEYSDNLRICRDGSPR